MRRVDEEKILAEPTCLNTENVGPLPSSPRRLAAMSRGIYWSPFSRCRQAPSYS